MSDHRGMLADADTELKNARSTFVLANQRITTHDLVVKSDDYGITGDGWFDLDNNISMSMDIQLTFGLSVTIPGLCDRTHAGGGGCTRHSQTRGADRAGGAECAWPDYPRRSERPEQPDRWRRFVWYQDTLEFKPARQTKRPATLK